MPRTYLLVELNGALHPIVLVLVVLLALGLLLQALADALPEELLLDLQSL